MAIEDEAEFPAEVEGILDAGVHPLTSFGGVRVWITPMIKYTLLRRSKRHTDSISSKEHTVMNRESITDTLPNSVRRPP